ncbi:MAG TPA: pilus assembly protein N-terminal domain-containing protein [Pseudolabrys sp.]|nr:pilus assembly protein N-terminal domain-containing protein [Pseudolabrys sp.]
MSAVSGRRRRLFRVWAWTIIFAATLGAQAQGDTITVSVDQAQVLKLPEKVTTVVIGNPLIADAALQSGGIMVVTGKGYGSTNLLALDRSGRVIMDKTVEVLGPSGPNLVVVYKGIERETYSCAPECKPRITLGDSVNYFNGALSQGGARTGGAQAAAPAK